MTETATEITVEPWQILSQHVRDSDVPAAEEYLTSLPANEKARAFSRLSVADQQALLRLLPSETSAGLLLEMPESQAAQLLDMLDVAENSEILNHAPSDEQADLLGLLDPHKAEIIIEHMEPREALHARELKQFPRTSAGGLMVKEYLAFNEAHTIGTVVDDLLQHSEEYSGYNIQYLYVVSADYTLVGVLRFRDLLLVPRHMRLDETMVRDPLHLKTNTTLAELRDVFQRHPFFGMPVVDDAGKMLGVVRRQDVEEASAESAEQELMRFGGLISGEELRSMPVYLRAMRRLIWLGLTIVLNLISASVIGVFEETLSAVIALAIFLPVISGVGGSSGNQAVAVSMRELTIGLLKPYEFVWVLVKELQVGVINGLALGVFLALVTYIWHGNFHLGLIVGLAMTCSTLIAVSFGGTFPLLLKRLGIDPALGASPMVMTVVDACSFFFALSLASAAVDYL